MLYFYRKSRARVGVPEAASPIRFRLECYPRQHTQSHPGLSGTPVMQASCLVLISSSCSDIFSKKQPGMFACPVSLPLRPESGLGSKVVIERYHPRHQPPNRYMNEPNHSNSLITQPLKLPRLASPPPPLSICSSLTRGVHATLSHHLSSTRSTYQGHSLWSLSYQAPQLALAAAGRFCRMSKIC